MRGGTDAGAHVRDAGVGEDRIEQGWVLAVSVADEVAGGRGGVVEVHREVTCGLGDPHGGGMRGGAENSDASGAVFDHREDVQARAGQRHGLEEVGGEDRVGLGAEESVQVVAVRSCAGSMPAWRMISQTVDGATLMPRVRSSPGIRR